MLAQFTFIFEYENGIEKRTFLRIVLTYSSMIHLEKWCVASLMNEKAHLRISLASVDLETERQLAVVLRDDCPRGQWSQIAMRHAGCSLAACGRSNRYGE